MKIPGIKNITNSIKKGLIATMIATPTAGALQSCESMAIVMTRDVPVYVHPIHVGPHVPPPRIHNFYQPPRPPIGRPPIHSNPTPPPQPRIGYQGPQNPPPKTHTNQHGDTFQKGGRR